MKIYRSKNVLEAARQRVRWIFDEFPYPIVNFSGGKDSETVLHLSLEAAERKGTLPLRVVFIDQEAEWQATIDRVKEVMYDPRVEPYWYQMPIRMSNATSVEEHWLMAWHPEYKDRWMHPQDPIAIKENHLPTDRFHDLFGAIAYDIAPQGTAAIAGLRAEEAPGRTMALTTGLHYKGITWMASQRPHGWGNLVFYPIYDWTIPDVWKYIHEGGHPYNKIYDKMYQMGFDVAAMRVSHLHHEEAIKSVFTLQELEPATYEKLTLRVAGIDSAAKFGLEDYHPTRLPPMFGSWKEYRDYLLKHLITNDEWREKMKVRFRRHDKQLVPYLGDGIHRKHVGVIVTNDWEFARLKQFEITARNKVLRIKRAEREREETEARIASGRGAIAGG